MSRKTDYIISLEATTERSVTHFPALKNKESRLSDRGKVNTTRRARASCDSQETSRACNAIFITRPRTCLGKNDKFMFPRPTPASTRRFSPRFIFVVIFIRGRGIRRKLDRNVFTTRLFIKPSTGKQIRSIYTARAFVFAHLSLEIMLHKRCRHNTLVYFAHLWVFGFSIEALKMFHIKKVLYNEYRGMYVYNETRSHVRIDLFKLREYCFNVNFRIMYRWAISGSSRIWKLLPLRRSGASPRGRWRGIKSEREMIYPSITHRRRHPMPVSPRFLTSSRILLEHNAKIIQVTLCLLCLNSTGK